jgi:hypothetical protein
VHDAQRHGRCDGHAAQRHGDARRAPEQDQEHDDQRDDVQHQADREVALHDQRILLFHHRGADEAVPGVGGAVIFDHLP